MKRAEIAKKAEKVMDSAVTRGQIKNALSYVTLAIKCVEPIMVRGHLDWDWHSKQGRLTGLLRQGYSKLQMLAEIELAKIELNMHREQKLKKRNALIKKVKRLGFLPGGRG